MQINFVTATKISLLDITSMGDSSKREDSKTIGKFDSGLKYAIALLLRSNVNITISVKGNSKVHENWEEDCIETYTFDTFTETSSTGKTKELIKVNVVESYLGGHPMNQYDMREPSSAVEYEVKTGFAKSLGYNWELWMALRELYSNMSDEGGYYAEKYFDVADDIGEGTVINLTFGDENEFYNIWQNRHLYVNENPPLFIVSPSLEVLSNEENYLRIYKQNILVYSDKSTPSRFAYNIKFGDIDERRILNNLYAVESQIVSGIRFTENTEFLREIITEDFITEDKEFLSSHSLYSATASDLIHNIASEVYEKYGEVKSYSWLIDSVKSRKDCRIAGKTIKTVEDSIWDYSTKVIIESHPIPLVEENSITVDDVTYLAPFSAEIKKHYNFELDVQVKTAKLKGSKVVADKYEKCLIIDENFSIQEDFPEFLVQYIDLTKSGNVVKNLSIYLANVLRIKN